MNTQNIEPLLQHIAFPGFKKLKKLLAFPGLKSYKHVAFPGLKKVTNMLPSQACKQLRTCCLPRLEKKLQTCCLPRLENSYEHVAFPGLMFFFHMLPSYERGVAQKTTSFHGLKTWYFKNMLYPWFEAEITPEHHHARSMIFLQNL